jgi:hypothetical protein
MADTDLPVLTAEEWHAAMATVLAAHAEDVHADYPESKPATAVSNVPKKKGPARRAPAKMQTPKAPPAKAGEDLDDDAGDNLAMANGSFFIQSEGDLVAKIDSIRNAELTAQVKPGRPYALDVKAHIYTRASALGKGDLVPAEWVGDLKAADMLKAGQATVIEHPIPGGDLDAIVPQKPAHPPVEEV